MSSGRNESNPKDKASGSTDETRGWPILKPIWWLGISIKNPDNLPVFLTALFTLLLVIFAYYAWSEAQIGTKAMQDQLTEMKNARRPWVSFNTGDIEISRPLTFDDNGASLDFKVPMKNGGSSIAIGVHVEATLHVAPLPAFNGPIQVARQVVLANMNGACSPQTIAGLARAEGRILLPSEGDIVPSSPGGSTVKKDQFRFNSQSGDVSVWIPYCVGYLDDVGNPHGTGTLLYYSPASTGAMHFAPTGIVQGGFNSFAVSWIVF